MHNVGLSLNIDLKEKNDGNSEMDFMTLAHFRQTNNHLRHPHRHHHSHHRHHAQQPIWKSAQLVVGSINPSRLLIRQAVDEAEAETIYVVVMFSNTT